MDLIEGIKTRRSIRAFILEPVPRATLEHILDAAKHSPSYTNTQPWEVAVVRGSRASELSAKLLKLAASEVTARPELPSPTIWPPVMQARAEENGRRRFQALGVERADKAQRLELMLNNFRFYGGSTVIFLFMDKALTTWSIFDLGAFTQTLCLAAHAEGIGTCIQAMLRIYPDVVKSYLGIPEEKMLLAGISMGFPDPGAKINRHISTRADPSEFTRWIE